MKTLLTLFLTAFASVSMFAQAPPEAFNYSGAARDGGGNPVANEMIGLEFSILKGSPVGSEQYTEWHFVETDDLGVFNVAVGFGAPQSGSFSDIDWSDDKYFFKVSLDISGGTNFVEMGVTQLLSVPYALYAKSAGTAPKTVIVAGDFVTVTGEGTEDEPYVVSATRGFTGPAIFTEGGGITDIDGNLYKTVVIGEQEWMAENLKVTKYRNGVIIPNLPTAAAWKSTNSGAWINYNNNPDRDEVYGKLYNWYAVADNKGLCPSGWHVPTEEDWIKLLRTIDPFSNPAQGTSGFSGGMMKSSGTLQQGSGVWMFPNAEASNGSGFSGIPGGRRLQDGNFSPLGFDAYWWSSTEGNLFSAPARSLVYGFGVCNRINNPKRNGLSVRCVKD
jgi:uncharacterized protein (TIGR02145 family)